MDLPAIGKGKAVTEIVDPTKLLNAFAAFIGVLCVVALIIGAWAAWARRG
jgi:uncharacterized membrane protein YqjE